MQIKLNSAIIQFAKVSVGSILNETHRADKPKNKKEEK